MDDIGLQKAIDFTENIKNLISSQPFTIIDKAGKIECWIKASFGIAGFPDVATNSHELLRLADIAMYYVKSHGRDNIAFMDKNGKTKLLDEQTYSRNLS